MSREFEAECDVLMAQVLYLEGEAFRAYSEENLQRERELVNRSIGWARSYLDDAEELARQLGETTAIVKGCPTPARRSVSCAPSSPIRAGVEQPLTIAAASRSPDWHQAVAGSCDRWWLERPL